MSGTGNGSNTAAECMRLAARAKGASYRHTITTYHKNTRRRQQASTQEGREGNHNTKNFKGTCRDRESGPSAATTKKRGVAQCGRQQE